MVNTVILNWNVQRIQSENRPLDLWTAVGRKKAEETIDQQTLAIYHENRKVTQRFGMKSPEDWAKSSFLISSRPYSLPTHAWWILEFLTSDSYVPFSLSLNESTTVTLGRCHHFMVHMCVFACVCAYVHRYIVSLVHRSWGWERLY